MKKIRSGNIKKSKNKTLKQPQSLLKATRLLTQGDVKGLPQLEKTAKLKKAGDSVSLSNKDMLFDNLITVEELAVIFRLAPQTIRNWIALGKIPYVKIDRRYVFRKRSVQEWLNQKEESQWQ